jgi:plasmid maintenance system killer protein
LINQYKKSKNKLLNWELSWIDLKEREPKKSWVWSFRINKQYRVVWFFDNNNDFIVSYIDNHQNY